MEEVLTDEPDIDFNPDVFNNMYWLVRDAMYNHDIRYIWIYGGSSASKTYSVVQAIIVDMIENDNSNALVLRKYATDIRDSIYADFTSIIKLWGLEDEFIMQINYIECKSTGSFVRFRGLDDSEKVKGISQFKRVILEEISQFEESDLKQIRKRLRGMAGQQIIGIFNPISDEHWLKKKIFDKEPLVPAAPMALYAKEKVKRELPIAGYWLSERGNTVVIKTNYLDNIYIVGKWEKRLEVDGEGKLVQVAGFYDKHTIEDFEKDKEEDYNYYNIYGLGNWGKIRTGGEFWKDFKYDRHVTTGGYNPALPVWMVWDDNVHPWPQCSIFQIYGPDNNIMRNSVSLKGKWVCVQVAEICLEDPRNNQEETCIEFIQRFPPNQLHKIYLSGDRTAMKEDTKLKKGENFYTKIMQYVSDYHPELRMQGSSPSVWDSRGFVNDILKGNGDIVFLVNADCKKSIDDYQYCLEAPDGTVAKIKVKHPITKVSYEPYGHASDVLRYFFTTAFNGQYGAYLQGGRRRLPQTGKNISKNKY